MVYFPSGEWITFRAARPHLAMKGATSKQIQSLAGHESLSTTEGYMHLAPGQAELAIALLNPPVALAAGATGEQQPQP